MIKLGTNSIGKIYLGSNSIGKAYLGSNLVFQRGSQPVQLIPYIRGGADGSYIDTGITPDETTKVIVWARNWNPTGDALFGVGSGATGATNTFLITQPASTQSGRIHLMYGTVGSPWASIDGFNYSSGYHKYELYAGVVKIDDVSRITGSTTATISTEYPIHLFGRCSASGGHTSMNLPVDICACKIYKNNVLVRDYTAVNTPSVGLYDAVSDTVFTNAGTGSFTYGSFNPNAYTPLEYVESSGASYFDAGIKGSNSLDYVAKFMPNDSTAWPNLFLAQTSSSSKRYGLAFGNSTTPCSRIYFVYNTSNETYNNTTSLNGTTLVAVKDGATLGIYRNNSSLSTLTHTAATFTTDYNIYVFSGNDGGNSSYPFSGRIYYLSFGSIRNFVPAKKNNVAGMYDTYNDVFYPSVTSTPFIAGNEL